MQTPVTAYVKLSEDKPLEAKFIQKKKKKSIHFISLSYVCEIIVHSLYGSVRR